MNGAGYLKKNRETIGGRQGSVLARARPGIWGGYLRLVRRKAGYNLVVEPHLFD